MLKRCKKYRNENAIKLFQSVALVRRPNRPMGPAARTKQGSVRISPKEKRDFDAFMVFGFNSQVIRLGRLVTK